MKYYSTNHKDHLVSFSTAVKKGIADDGGLYLPVSVPKFNNNFFQNIQNISFQDIAFAVSQPFVTEDIPDDDLRNIIENSLTFPVPLVELGHNQYVLELYHGPTLAFKDFGARFMANTLSYLIRNDNNEIIILVATSGDTGSAVANGFFNVNGIKVVLLYPSGKVSKMQEQQLTTLDGNITALEISGSFDDCQHMVKQAFADDELKSALNLSSANSINIARLLPQSFYYFNAYAQLKDKQRDLIFSVPSGNLGNLTGGLIAMQMGLPVHKFIAAVNANDVIPLYLKTGIYTPKPSVPTMSNAMDVGNPSNFVRILALYNYTYEAIKKIVFSKSYSDEETKNAVKMVYSDFNYLLDPHGAVGYLALQDFLRNRNSDYNSVILETAHPAKFANELEPLLNKNIEIPVSLAHCLSKKKKSVKLSNTFNDLKSFLLEEMR